MTDPVRRDTPTVRPPSRSGAAHPAVSEDKPSTANDAHYRRRQSGMRRKQRSHERTEFRQPVQFGRPDGERNPGIATNISLGGAYIESSEARVAFGDRLILRLPLPRLAEPAEIEATVRWCSDTGFGVQFSAMGARITHALTQVIAR